MNFIKRMQEINARKAELRSMLQGTDEVNLDEIEKELRELDTEYQALEKRKATIDGINMGIKQNCRQERIMFSSLGPDIIIQTMSSKAT